MGQGLMRFQKAIYKLVDGDSVWLAPNVGQTLVVDEVKVEKGEITVMLRKADPGA